MSAAYMALRLMQMGREEKIRQLAIHLNNAQMDNKLFQRYCRKEIVELRPYEEGEKTSGSVYVSGPDREAGSPKVGDMIARDPKNHANQWLVSASDFSDNFEPL